MALRPLLRRAPAESWLIITIGVFLSVVVVALLGFELWREHGAVEAEAFRDTSNLAALLEPSVVESIRSADEVLRDFVTQVKADGREGNTEPSRPREDALSLPPGISHVTGLLLLDASGRVLVSSIPSLPPGTDLSDAEYYVAVRAAGPTESQPHIGRLIQDRRTSRWLIPMSRSVYDARDTFQGVAIAFIDPAAFVSAFSQLDVDRFSAATLRQSDGVIVARSPAPENFVGRSLLGGSLDSRVTSGAPTGSLRIRGILYGRDLLISYRVVVGTPFTLNVAFDTNRTFQQWNSLVRLYVAIGLAFLAAIAACVWLLLDDQSRRRTAAAIEARNIIAERRQAERAAEASEERYASLVNSLDGIVWEADAPTLRFRFVSPQAEQLLGYPVSQWLEEPDFWRNHIHPEDRDRTLQALFGSAHGGGHAFECRLLAADGREVWLDNVVSTTMVDGEAVALRGITVDVTDRKRAEKEHREMEARVQHAQKLESLGILAGGIAHDFNNLLTSILGYADLALQSVKPDDPVAEMLNAIKQSSQNAAGLTKQMLAYAGKGTFTIQSLQLDALVREMVPLLKTVMSKKTSIELKLEPATIEGDATQIRQVIMNLLTNASDALEGEPGVVRVRTGVRYIDAAELRSRSSAAELPSASYAYLEVQDTGFGMTDETRARIFDPFFTTKFTGRGLGLAAVLGIIHGHHGTITVESTVGLGSVFTVFFPFTGATTTRDADSADEGSVPRGRGTLLVVDDDAEIRAYARQVLERAGFAVRMAEDGHQALEMIAQHRQEIAAVLLDLTMPRMDGLEVMQRLRSLDASLPVLVMSGYSDADVAMRIPETSTCGFIEKPFLPRDLVTRVTQLLAHKPGSGAA